MADNNSIADRLKLIVDSSGKTVQDFAETVGIDRSQFGRVLKGKLNITLKQVLEISSHYNIRIGWIIEGEEPMNKEKSGTFKAPDPLLTRKLKAEIDQMRLSLQRLSELVPSDQKEETEAQEVQYARIPGDKSQKAGKR